MLLVPGCTEPETASTFLNQQLDPRSCVNPGITPRLRGDGTPDCPNAREPGSALVDNAVRGLGRGLDNLRREMDNRFGDRSDPPR
jgi:hypothetical protein